MARSYITRNFKFHRRFKQSMRGKYKRSSRARRSVGRQFGG